MENKMLRKSNTNKKIAGVLGGFGEYYNWSSSTVTILRVVLVLAFLFTSGLFGLAYLMAAMIMPSQNAAKKETYKSNTFSKSTNNKVWLGVIGGTGEYFGFTPGVITLLRVAFAVFAFCSFGTALVVYLVMAMIMPKNTNTSNNNSSKAQNYYDYAEDKPEDDFEYKKTFDQTYKSWVNPTEPKSDPKDVTDSVKNNKKKKVDSFNWDDF